MDIITMMARLMLMPMLLMMMMMMGLGFRVYDDLMVMMVELPSR